MMEGEQLWGQLQQSWLVLTPEGAALPLISMAHAEGVVAALYSDRALAETAIARHAAGRFDVYPAPPLWQAMRLLAEQGYAGILVDEQLPLFFVTIAPGEALPTHLALPDKEEYLVVGEAGPTALRRAAVERWGNLAAFDRLACRWLLGESTPFLGYEPDGLLYDFAPGGEPPLVPERGALLAPAGVVEYAFPLFSSTLAAEWFWRQQGEPWAEGAEAQIAPHEEVPARLDELVDELPAGAALILNPGRHRFYQGFFRRAGHDWFLVTINGLWQIDSPFRCTRIARRRD